MGRTWKFTEQIYEELRENVDKKITTRFPGGVLGSGNLGVFGNPFEKYASEIDMGMSKMNTYVDMINEADGFDRARLDRVFGQIAETDKKYGNQIKKCTEDIVHYNNVLEQIVEVMGQAFKGSGNGNAVFDFDREAFQALVKDDKNAMDIAYVDRILSKDVSEITEEEYMEIAALLINQGRDTTLIQYILNSGYLWNFTDVWEGEFGMSPEAVEGEGQYSNAVFLPNEKYVLLEAALKEFASTLVMNKPLDNASTQYLDMLNNAIMYTNLLDMAWEHMYDSKWGYPIDTKEEYEKLILKDLFTIEYGTTSIGENAGFLVEIKNCYGFGAHYDLEILKPFNSQSAPKGMDDLENAHINHYLKLDMSDRAYLSADIINRILGTEENKIKNNSMKYMMDLLHLGDYAGAVIKVSGLVSSVSADFEKHKEQQEVIDKFQKEGSLGSAIQTLDMYCSVGEYRGEENSAEITVYPTSVTEERIEMLNRLLEDEDISYMDEVDTSMLPNGRFTMDFVVEHIDVVDNILDIMEDDVRANSSYHSLLEILEAEYAN